MKALYITGDAIGTATGGGRVTFHEAEALREAFDDDIEVWSEPGEPRPWGPDDVCAKRVIEDPSIKPILAHFYAGTFTKTIAVLRDRGTKITYTAAAHNINASAAEHEALGVPFDYPHLKPPLWSRYINGYLNADLLICPSALSRFVMQVYSSACPPIVILPHGFDQPHKIKPLPERFVVGYLGQPGPDKGLRCLLLAWAKVSKERAGILMIAGRGTELLADLVRQISPKAPVIILGEVADASELYNACSIYVQPSVTEGFGIEILEALAHGRHVIASVGAGASTYATQSFPANDVNGLAGLLTDAIDHPPTFEIPAVMLDTLTWPEIRKRYVNVFRSFR